jgi:hypothetical protein
MSNKSEKRRAIRDLMLDSFTLTEVEEFLKLNGYDDVANAVSPNLGAAQFCFQVVQALDRMGRIDSEFFDHLIEARPAKVTQINALRQLVLSNDRTSVPEGKVEDVPLIDGIGTQDWQVVERSNGVWDERGSVVNGTYIWEVRALKGGFTAQMPSSLPAASDFELQAKIRLIHGSDLQYGLFFRKSNESGYYFLLDNTGHDGRFGLNLWLAGGQIKNLIPWTSSPSIHTQGGNDVKIVSRGPEIRLFINDKSVGLITDATSTAGQIGLAASLNEGESCTVELSNFKFRTGSFSASALSGPTASNSGSGDVDEYQVVLLVHGIRDQGEWQSTLKNMLEVPGKIEVIPIKYGYFDPLKFWFPFWTRTWTRRRPIGRVYTQIQVALQVAREKNPNAKLSIIAHSFGTYIIGQILKRGFDLHIHRLILCGSILPQDFPWQDYEGRFDRDKVINECGKSDIWPVLAQSLSRGYGASGTHGFGAMLVKDRVHAGGHGQYFKAEFVVKYWDPFIRRGEYQATEFEKSMPPTPWWVLVLETLPLQWLLVGLTMLTIVLFLPVSWHHTTPPKPPKSGSPADNTEPSSKSAKSLATNFSLRYLLLLNSEMRHRIGACGLQRHPVPDAQNKLFMSDASALKRCVEILNGIELRTEFHSADVADFSGYWISRLVRDYNKGRGEYIKDGSSIDADKISQASFTLRAALSPELQAALSSELDENLAEMVSSKELKDALYKFTLLNDRLVKDDQILRAQR